MTENGNLTEDELEETLNDSIDSLILSDAFEAFCDDCARCICNEICSTMADCEALFEDFKNQVITIDDIKETWEEEAGMNVW